VLDGLVSVVSSVARQPYSVVRGYGAVPTLVQGFAMGTFFIALLTITFDRLPADKLPAASGLNNFLRITASGFATSLTTTFWDRRESLHQTRLVESLTAFSPAFRQGVRNHHELRTQRSLG
jgi:DHA2 family multidrug resistance protein